MSIYIQSSTIIATATNKGVGKEGLILELPPRGKSSLRDDARKCCEQYIKSDFGSIHLRAEMAFRAETFGEEFCHRAKTFGTK